MLISFSDVAAAKQPTSRAFFKNANGKMTVSTSAEVAGIMRQTLFEICSANNNLTAKVKEKDYANALTDLQQGKSDIALVNHKPTYLALKSNEWNVVYLAATALVIVTNERNKVTGFKSNELAKIFSRQIINWQSFTGVKADIHLIGLDAETSGGAIFHNLIMKKELISRYFFSVTTGREVDIIISADQYAIGFRMYDKPADDAKVKLVSIDNIRPEPATIINGKYPLTIRYYLCYNKKSKNSLVAKFIEYFKTTGFADKITRAGLISPSTVKK